MRISEVKNLLQLAGLYADHHKLSDEQRIQLEDFAKVVDRQFVLSVNVANQLRVKVEGTEDYEFKWKDEIDASIE